MCYMQKIIVHSHLDQHLRKLPLLQLYISYFVPCANPPFISRPIVAIERIKICMKDYEMELYRMSADSLFG